MNAIRIISDLHLEKYGRTELFAKYFKNRKIDTRFLALLGDIGDPAKEHYKNFLLEQADQYERIFVIAGNHEYYFKSIQEGQNMINDLCARRQNLHFLENDTTKIGDKEILGTTLWTQLSANHHRRGDLRHIHLGVAPVKSLNRLHEESLHFLHEEIIENCIVLSHHAPSVECLKRDDKFYFANGERVKDMFASDLEYLFGHGVHTWAYGHTHIPFDKLMDGTRVVSNPFCTSRGFDIDLHIPLD